MEEWLPENASGKRKDSACMQWKRKAMVGKREESAGDVRKTGGSWGGHKDNIAFVGSVDKKGVRVGEGEAVVEDM